MSKTRSFLKSNNFSGLSPNNDINKNIILMKCQLGVTSLQPKNFQQYCLKETVLSNLFEFFYNSLFPAKLWQDPASIDGEEQNKKVAPTED